MGFATKGFVLVQLSVLLLSCFTVFGNFPQPPVHPPSHPPIHPPSHEPAHPPIHPPAQPPHHHRNPHHKHGHPPSPSPVHPPVHSPSHPPAHPPSVAPAPHHHSNHPHHHGHPPSHSPAHPPVHPPVKSPAHPPVNPPAHPPVKPPAHPPVKAPAHPPVKPPTPPPALPPVRRPVDPPVHHFPRSFIAVEGVVYCKTCKYAGVDTLSGASPLSGATVKLQCNNTKYPAVETGKTDKNGYFFITAPKSVTSYAAHKCKVFLVSSPVATCSKLSNFNDGLKGSLLRPEKPYVVNKLPFVIYSVGPFAFEPTCPR